MLIMEEKNKDKLMIALAQFGNLVLMFLLILQHYFNKQYYFYAMLFFGLGWLNFVFVKIYFKGLTKKKKGFWIIR